MRMYALVRPLLFVFPPDVAHGLAMTALGPLEYLAPLRWTTRAFFSPPRSAAKTVMGLTFPSPLGLAAGFERNGGRARGVAALGFGHLEIGTVTARAQEPNPPPNMFRLPRDHALVNRMGFPNEGAEAVCTRLLARGGSRVMGVPLGISIG